MKAYFNLPGLFEKFHLVKKIIQLKEEQPYIFRDNVVLYSFYGSNGGITNGGRNTNPCNIEKEVSEYMNVHNITPTIIMSNLLVKEEMLPDTFASNILNNFDINKTMFCVANPVIENWLQKQGIGKGQFILSTTACLTPQQIIDKYDRYNRIVLSEELINNWVTILSFPEHVRNKLEIIVNTVCPAKCYTRKEHYIHMSKVCIGENTGSFPCSNKDFCGNGRFYEVLQIPNAVNIDMINTYINLGINHFKIQGRTADDNDLIETFAYYLAKPNYQMEFRYCLHS